MFFFFSVRLILFLVLFSPHYTGAILQGLISFFSQKRSFLLLPAVFGSMGAGAVTIGLRALKAKLLTLDISIGIFAEEWLWKFFCLYWVSLYVVLLLAYIIGKAGQKKFARYIEEEARMRLV